MKKVIVAFVALLSLATFACAAPQVLDSGLSGANGQPRSNWDSALTGEVATLWMKIPSGEVLADGSSRYAFTVTYTSPDRNGVVKEGPIDFRTDGLAKVYKPIAFFNGIKTRYYPRPNQGKWRVDFTLIDKGDKDRESKLGDLTFYLAGSDPAQIATNGTGIVPPPPAKEPPPKVYSQEQLKKMAEWASTTTTTLPPKKPYTKKN